MKSHDTRVCRVMEIQFSLDFEFCFQFVQYWTNTRVRSNLHTRGFIAIEILCCTSVLLNNKYWYRFNTREKHHVSFRNCKPCPVTKPVFICGSDNRTYSSLCRLDYHNCIHATAIKVACKGFCPCRGKFAQIWCKVNEGMDDGELVWCMRELSC